jgi:hypothetical protein
MTQATGVKARQSPGTAPTEEGVLVRMAIGFELCGKMGDGVN